MPEKCNKHETLSTFHIMSFYSTLMYTRIVNYKNASTCKAVILKKATAETSIRNGGYVITF